MAAKEAVEPILAPWERTVEREWEASHGTAFLLNMPLLGGCRDQDAYGPDDP